jgi:DNA-binding CsgD family transcriptional regulator
LFGPLVGLLWLAYPIQALLKSNPSSAQILFALAGTTLFVAVFLGLIWLGQPLRAAATDVSEVRKRRAARERVVDPGLAAAALSEGESPLTGREREVLSASANGATIEDVAAKLYLSEGTVRNYLSTAIKKLGARNRVEAARLAERKGWL